jgi:hypothetical protein
VTAIAAKVGRRWPRWPGAAGPLSEAADWFDQAARDLRGGALAQRVWQGGTAPGGGPVDHRDGQVSRFGDTLAILHLIVTVAALAENLAMLRGAQDCLHPARAVGPRAAWTPPQVSGTGRHRCLDVTFVGHPDGATAVACG